MKKSLPLVLVLSACLTACGGSSDDAGGGPGDSGSSSSSGGSKQWVTDPAKLPGDEEGLAEVYGDLMTEVVETMEGIETKADLDAGLDHVAELAPAFSALMKRSEDLDLAVDGEEVNEEIDALAERMDAAMGSTLKKFPKEAMRIMNAFSEMTGGVGPR